MAILPQAFYVYVLARPNGTPFYVGKGKRWRIYEHEREARTGHKCHKCNIIRKIWKGGGEVQRYTIFTTIDESDAFAYERETIALYGRKNLCNQTDGGEGASGHPMPEHVKQMMIRRNTGQKHSVERRDKVAEGQRKGQTFMVMAPDGTLYYDVANVSRFEQDHGLPKAGLHAVLENKRAKRAAGWSIVRSGDPLPSPPKHYVVIAPDGTRYEHIMNPNALAKEHGISGHQLRAVLRGDRQQHKGWIGWGVGQEPNSKPHVYTITDPSGVIYHDVRNITAFARDHGLCVSSLRRTASGQYQQHKGWTVRSGGG